MMGCRHSESHVLHSSCSLVNKEITAEAIHSSTAIPSVEGPCLLCFFETFL